MTAVAIELSPILLDGSAPGVEGLPPHARDVLDQTVAHYGRAGFEPPWIAYAAREGDAIVGMCAFKWAPREGQVEIAYYTLPEQENRGVATAMATQLVAIAASSQAPPFVTARTLVEPNASHRVLQKAGFRARGPVVDPEDGEVLEWFYE